MTLRIATRPHSLATAVNIHQGDHACLIYDEDPAEQADFILSFLMQGIAGGERCVFVSFEPRLQWLRSRLEDAGMDVDLEAGRGAMLLWTPDRWRKRGSIPSLKRVAHIWTYIQDAIGAGFTGVRFVIDKAWYNDEDVDLDKIREWEATIDAVFTPDVPARLICLYGQGVLPAEVIESGLSSHPVVLVGSQACPNPYYDAPLLLQSDSLDYLLSAPTSRMEWMLSRLHQVFEHRATTPDPSTFSTSLAHLEPEAGFFIPEFQLTRP